ncbi:hypothetical protein [Deferribacter abyssi]|uniref:hypothetical protein n=1 Tax=Deferribacter abyssi TaxID=213806 RepID=UPI003C19C4E6
MNKKDDLNRRTNNLKSFKGLAKFLKDFQEDDTPAEDMAIKMEEAFEKVWKKHKPDIERSNKFENKEEQ